MEGGLKAATLAALERLGGVDYLVRQGEENPKAFLGLLAKLMGEKPTLPPGAAPGKIIVHLVQGELPLE